MSVGFSHGKDFSLKDIKKYVPERYEHAKEFCEKNGLA